MYSFQEIWLQKPKREGGNPRKKAERAFNARVKEGADPKDIMAGVLRYEKYCIKKDMVGSPYVMQMATFIGPEYHFEEDWQVYEPTSVMQLTGENRLTRDTPLEERLVDRSWAH